jgi:hypothetical protein
MLRVPSILLLKIARAYEILLFRDGWMDKSTAAVT